MYVGMSTRYTVGVSRYVPNNYTFTFFCAMTLHDKTMSSIISQWTTQRSKEDYLTVELVYYYTEGI